MTSCMSKKLADECSQHNKAKCFAISSVIFKYIQQQPELIGCFLSIVLTIVFICVKLHFIMHSHANSPFTSKIISSITSSFHSLNSHNVQSNKKEKVKKRKKMLPMDQNEAGASVVHCPPGFRFHPSDEELIVHYLQNKANSRPLPASIIAEIDLYKYNPWDLPKKALFGDDEWYFFSPRDRKYPKGERPNRAAGSGYWKATGTDKPILTSSGSKSIGVRKGLVFYKGRPPKGVKTEWIMTEYRLLDTSMKPQRLKGSMRLDGWVLCRVRHKGNINKKVYEFQDSINNEMAKHIPNLEEIDQPMPANCNVDLITDCLNKDCQILACILAGQGLPPIENISHISFQGRNNSGIDFSSSYKHGSSKISPSVRVSSLSNINSLKRKSNDEDMSEILVSINKKINCGNRNEVVQSCETIPENDLYYNQNHFQDRLYPNPSDLVIGLMEIGKIAPTSRLTTVSRDQNKVTD